MKIQKIKVICPRCGDEMTRCKNPESKNYFWYCMACDNIVFDKELKYKTYNGYITKLEANQIFVYGSNLGGWHGAGSAGYASFGVSGNKWRQFDYDKMPNGWKGKWNVKGIGEGIQEGTEGKSYALPTVKYAGAKQSLNKDQIVENIRRLYDYATDHPELEFLIAYRDDGSRLLNGYTTLEMAEMFSSLIIPENIVFEDNFYKLMAIK